MTYAERSAIVDALSKRASALDEGAEYDCLVELMRAVIRFYHTQTWAGGGYPYPVGLVSQYAWSIV
jgi:hypothetical protein